MRAGHIGNVWGNWFGGAFQSLVWDSASDANTNPASGSMKITANFPVSTDQFEVWDGLSAINPGLNGLQFTNFQCDVRFAAGSATKSGTFGNLQFGIPTPSNGQDYFNGGNFRPREQHQLGSRQHYAEREHRPQPEIYHRSPDSYLGSGAGRPKHVVGGQHQVRRHGSHQRHGDDQLYQHATAD